MADHDEDLPYAEMVSRQAAADVARWRASETKLLWPAGRATGRSEDGCCLLQELIGVFDDKQERRAHEPHA